MVGQGCCLGLGGGEVRARDIGFRVNGEAENGNSES